MINKRRKYNKKKKKVVGKPENVQVSNVQVSSIPCVYIRATFTPKVSKLFHVFLNKTLMDFTGRILTLHNDYYAGLHNPDEANKILTFLKQFNDSSSDKKKQFNGSSFDGKYPGT